MTAKVFPAKFAGECSCCGSSFPKGAPIVYDGRPTLASCIERIAAEDAARDAEESERCRKSLEDFKAGRLISVDGDDKELMVRGAPSYRDARDAAFGFVNSVTAATGIKAGLVVKVRKGKRTIGRKVVTYYGMSTLGHFEGYAFPWRMAS